MARPIFRSWKQSEVSVIFTDEDISLVAEEIYLMHVCILFQKLLRITQQNLISLSDLVIFVVSENSSSVFAKSLTTVWIMSAIKQELKQTGFAV